MNKKIFNFKDIILIVIVTSLVMCFLGGLLVFVHLGGHNYSIFDMNKMKEFLSAYEDLKSNYYEDLNTDELIDGAIAGMYSMTGDPYTSHLSDNGSNSLNNSLTGKYKGVGIQLKRLENKLLEITKVLDNGPAKEAGLKEGDIIKAVDLEDIAKYDTTDLSNIITNHKNNKINFTIDRKGEILSFDVSIKTLYSPVTDEKVYDYNGHKVGYIYLYIFSENAAEQFSNSLKKLEKEKIDSLIIDLRNNTGGYLEIAKSISELFLKKNSVIYSVDGKDKKKVIKDTTEESRSYPVNVLINHTSASASEVLSAALKYSYNAKLVGKTTYGKGKIQEKSNLSDGTIIKYTTAKWLTPNGDCIDKVGLVPDINVEFDNENYDNSDVFTDNQFKTAIDDLTK